jgi:hypothetical protein
MYALLKHRDVVLVGIYRADEDGCHYSVAA